MTRKLNAAPRNFCFEENSSHASHVEIRSYTDSSATVVAPNLSLLNLSVLVPNLRTENVISPGPTPFELACPHHDATQDFGRSPRDGLFLVGYLRAESFYLARREFLAFLLLSSPTLKTTFFSRNRISDAEPLRMAHTISIRSTFISV